MQTENIDKLFFLVHILSVVAAFGAGFVYPMLGRQLSQLDSAVGQRFAGFAAQNMLRLNAPALILAGLFGIILVARSDKVFDWDQTWVNLALVTWVAMNGVLHAMVIPGQRKAGRGDASGARRAEIGDNLMGLLFLFMLYLMVFKPGW